LPSGPAFAPPPAMMARKIPNAAFMAEDLLLAAPPEGYRLEVRLPSMPQADTQFQSLLPESADSPFHCP
jgi:hypothetical protein